MPDPTVPVANPPPSPPPTPTNAPASVSVQSVTPDGGGAEAITLKPGASTSEFILTMMIVVLGYVTASGLITDNVTLRVVGIVSATLKAGMYTWSRTMVKAAAMICVVMFAFHTSACAGADATAINATTTTTKIAQASFEAYNDVHTTQITDKAPDKATGIASLQTWWIESAKIEKLFDGVYAAITLWATAKDHAHASDVLAAATALSAELHAAGVIK